MSYLDQYGVAEVKREKILSRTILTLIALAALSGFLYFWFKNYNEEKRVRDFLAALEHGDYAQAYTYWGCSVQAPCPNYTFQSFMEDWGQSSPVGKLQSYKLLSSHERGSGVEINILANNRPPPISLWVEKKSRVIGFSPNF